MKMPLDPLPLKDLEKWIPSLETLQWLQEGDEQTERLRQQQEEEATNQIVDLFATPNDEIDDSDRSDADFEGNYQRLRVWNSSRSNKDGVGSEYTGSDIQENQGHPEDDSKRIVYGISESWEGYGDMLWASSRHLANTFAYAEPCRDLLGPRWKPSFSSSSSSSLVTEAEHPLMNAKVLELGAGCGVPSLVAMKCGARVVCTDLDCPNRIRCIAEGMERNYEEMLLSKDKWKSAILENALLARAVPFRWGKSSEPVAKALSVGDDVEEDNRFDLIVATDCLFMPWLHYDLLQALEELLSNSGIAIMAFAIHEGFSKEHEVWPFVDKAKERGFQVETLEAVQLTPPKKGMPEKQGLVNLLRMTWAENKTS